MYLILMCKITQKSIKRQKHKKRGSDTSGCFVAGIVRGAFPCQVAICPPEREPGGEIVFRMIIAAIILIIIIILFVVIIVIIAAVILIIVIIIIMLVVVIIFIIITSMGQAIPNIFDIRKGIVFSIVIASVVTAMRISGGEYFLQIFIENDAQYRE